MKVAYARTVRSSHVETKPVHLLVSFKYKKEIEKTRRPVVIPRMYVFRNESKVRTDENVTEDNYSGMAGFDIDEISSKAKAEKIRDILFKKFDFVYAAGLTQSNQGVRLYVKFLSIEDDQRYYDEVCDIFQSNIKHHGKVDKSCRNLSRVFYCAYDPEFKSRKRPKAFIGNRVQDLAGMYYGYEHTRAFRNNTWEEGNRNNVAHMAMCEMIRVHNMTNEEVRSEAKRLVRDLFPPNSIANINEARAIFKSCESAIKAVKRPAVKGEIQFGSLGEMMRNVGVAVGELLQSDIHKDIAYDRSSDSWKKTHNPDRDYDGANWPRGHWSVIKTDLALDAVDGRYGSTVIQNISKLISEKAAGSKKLLQKYSERGCRDGVIKASLCNFIGRDMSPQNDKLNLVPFENGRVLQITEAGAKFRDFQPEIDNFMAACTWNKHAKEEMFSDLKLTKHFNDNFISDMVGSETAELLQFLLGAALIGKKGKRFATLTGPTGSGKTMLENCILTAFGPLARVATPGVFAELKDHNEQLYNILVSQARFVILSEVQYQDIFSEGLNKATGNNVMYARLPYGTSSVRAMFVGLPIFSGEYDAKFKSATPGTKARYVPFNMKHIPPQDRNPAYAIHSVNPNSKLVLKMLLWIVHGAVKYLQEPYKIEDIAEQAQERAKKDILVDFDSIDSTDGRLALSEWIDANVDTIDNREVEKGMTLDEIKMRFHIDNMHISPEEINRQDVKKALVKKGWGYQAGKNRRWLRPNR